ncbi:hypothetical protein GCM10011345_12140 [Gemmobacter megaterium]|nr:hypothetical protein GCM10011345_12140 [Gemmobacter megaterium]
MAPPCGRWSCHSKMVQVIPDQPRISDVAGGLMFRSLPVTGKAVLPSQADTRRQKGRPAAPQASPDGKGAGLRSGVRT